MRSMAFTRRSISLKAATMPRITIHKKRCAHLLISSKSEPFRRALDKWRGLSNALHEHHGSWIELIPLVFSANQAAGVSKHHPLTRRVEKTDGLRRGTVGDGPMRDDALDTEQRDAIGR